MTAQNLLDQLLAAGSSMLGAKGATPGAGSANLDWRQLGTGAAAGGALALLLGSKSGGRLGGSVLKLGSVAALGAVAYRAYTAWQQQQAGPGGVQPPAAANGAPQTVDLLPPPQAEQHSQAMLKAMIAAAKADGHVDEHERGAVEAELLRLEADPGLRRWFDDELRRPLDPAEVARSASTPALAAEMYLASLLVADETSFMERAYLDELARQMQLPAGLKAELESRARPD